MEDVRTLLEDQEISINAGRLPGLQGNTILYADDTTLHNQKQDILTHILHAVETTSSQYNMALNKDKCELLTFNTLLGLRFKDGSIVKHADEAKYLGCYFNWRADPSIELRRRISLTMTVWKRLDTFWIKAKAPIAFKLQ
eukprot:3399851-Prorocentrum_lima.AAC.1